MIHPTAIIEEGARIHESVEIGPYSIIESDVEISAGTRISSCVRIYGGTRIGSGNRIDHGAVLGCEPQDLSFSPEKGKPLVIGDNNHFREGVNVSRGVKEEHGTIIGNHNYLMAMSHIGHDCVVGDYNILANTATLAGHVEIEHHTFLSGQTATHQFCRIGAYAMVAGVTGVPKDIPPFMMADGHRAEVVGLNLVGLKRAGFSQQQRTVIKQAYKLIYRSGLKLQDALERLADNPDEQVQHMMNFIRGSKRGIIPHR